MSEQEPDDSWPPEVQAAFVAEAGKTFRWFIGGLTIFLAVVFGGFAPANLPSPIVAGIWIGLALSALGGMIGLAGFVYGRNQERFRERKTRELAARIRELEQLIDPDRTSSGLSPDGNTNPEDD